MKKAKKKNIRTEKSLTINGSLIKLWDNEYDERWDSC